MAGETPAAPPWAAAVPGLRIASLCSGYGGLDLAVCQVLGGDLVWVAETDKDASAVLRRHWPGVPNYGDITAIDWESLPPEARAVDVLTTGFPCQPFSQAGRRRGADDPRHLWPHVARAVGALRPQLVVLENVRGLLTARGGSPTAEHLAAEASRDAAAHLAGRLGGWLGNEAALAAVRGDAQRAAQCRERAARLEGLRKRQWLDASGTSGGSSGQPELFSGTWPTSGSMRNGLVSPRPAPGHRTAGIASSSSRGPLTAPAAGNPGDGEPPGSREPHQAEGRRPGVADESGRLLPASTSNVSGRTGDQHMAIRQSIGRNTPSQLEAVAQLLPTPSAADGAGGHTSRSGARKGEPLLGGIAQLLPTPVTSYSQRTPGQWRAGRPAGNGAVRERIADLGSSRSTCCRRRRRRTGAADPGHCRRHGRTGEPITGRDYGTWHPRSCRRRPRTSRAGPASSTWACVIRSSAPPRASSGRPAIAVLRPALVALENVRGHLTLGFDAVLGDLADMGYDAVWQVAAAAEAGAPHRRKRLFILGVDSGRQDGPRGRAQREPLAGAW